MGVYRHLGKAHPSGIYSHCLVQGDHCFRCSIHGIKIHEARIVDKELQIRYCCNACGCSCSSTLGNLLCFHPIVNRFARNSLSVNNNYSCCMARATYHASKTTTTRICFWCCCCLWYLLCFG